MKNDILITIFLRFFPENFEKKVKKRYLRKFGMCYNKEKRCRRRSFCFRKRVGNIGGCGKVMENQR